MPGRFYTAFPVSCGFRVLRSRLRPTWSLVFNVVALVMDYCQPPRVPLSLHLVYALITAWVALTGLPLLFTARGSRNGCKAVYLLYMLLGLL